MNTRLLRRIAAHITEEPKRLSMSDWTVEQDNPLDLVRDTTYAKSCPVHRFPECGTAACIGGWAEILSGTEDIPAGTLLKLSDAQEDRLFFNTSWPAKFRRAYRNAKTPKGKASAAVARIEHFIKTKGDE